MYRRSYLCTGCGRLRREEPAARPRCCGVEMQTLSYEQTVVASRLLPDTRSRWLADGGRIEKAAGKRRWKMRKAGGSG